MHFLDETRGSECFSWSVYVSWPYRYHLYFLSCVLLGCLSFLIECGGGLVVVSDFCILWTIPSQVPQSMGFPRQKYRNELPFPSPGALSNPGIEPTSLALQADSLPLRHQGSLNSGVAYIIYVFFPLSDTCIANIFFQLVT